jgi:hypothetical protein
MSISFCESCAARRAWWAVAAIEEHERGASPSSRLPSAPAYRQMRYLYNRPRGCFEDVSCLPMLVFLGTRAANCGAPWRVPGAPGSGANDATMHAHLGHSHACADVSSAREHVIAKRPYSLQRNNCHSPLTLPTAEAGGFSVLRRGQRHASPKGQPGPLYILGGVVVPMQAGPAVRAGVPADR